MNCDTEKNCNDYSGFVSMNVKMNAAKFIFKMNGRDRHSRTVRKAYLKNDTFLCFKLFSPYGLTRAPYKQSKCKIVALESMQRVSSLKIRDVSVS